MATAAGRFSLYPASFTYAGPTTFNVTDIRRAGLQPNSRVHRAPISGLVDPGGNLLASADPVVPWETRDLAGLFAHLNPMTGLLLTGGVLRYQQRDMDGGFFMGTNVHVSETFGGGFMYLNSIGATQDDETPMTAQCSVVLHSSDGLTAPVTRSTAATISGVTPAFGSAFYMGPVYYNGAEIPGVRSWSFDPGLTYVSHKDSGAVFPRGGTVTMRRATFRVDCYKLSADAAASVFIRALSGAGMSLYGRKAVDAGIRVADASLVHLKISAATGAWRVENIDASEQDDATVSFICEPTGAPTYSIASAIP